MKRMFQIGLLSASLAVAGAAGTIAKATYGAPLAIESEAIAANNAVNAFGFAIENGAALDEFAPQYADTAEMRAGDVAQAASADYPAWKNARFAAFGAADDDPWAAIGSAVEEGANAARQAVFDAPKQSARQQGAADVYSA